MNISELEFDSTGQITYNGKALPSHVAVALETARLAQINQRIADTLEDLFELLETTIQEFKAAGDTGEIVLSEPEPRMSPLFPLLPEKDSDE